MLKLDLANETQWNGAIVETIHENIILGDISEIVATLLSPTGEDCSMISQAEVKSSDVSRQISTDNDKMVLGQFEGAANLATKFSMFTQDKRNTWSYDLFENRLAIEISHSDTFTIVQGKWYDFKVEY